MIHKSGFVIEDGSGVLPDFDLSDNEPKFSSSNEQIVVAAMETIKKTFSN